MKDYYQFALGLTYTFTWLFLLRWLMIVLSILNTLLYCPSNCLEDFTLHWEDADSIGGSDVQPIPVTPHPPTPSSQPFVFSAQASSSQSRDSKVPFTTFHADVCGSGGAFVSDKRFILIQCIWFRISSRYQIYRTFEPFKCRWGFWRKKFVVVCCSEEIRT